MTCHRPAISAPIVRRPPSLSSLKSTPKVPTVDDGIKLYLDSLLDRGVKENSLIAIGISLRTFFRPALLDPLPSLTPALVEKLAHGLATEPSPRTDRMLGLGTRTSYRGAARRFVRWAREQGRLQSVGGAR